MAEIDAKNKALVTGRSSPFYSEGAEEDVALSPTGDLLVAQGLPELTSLVRLGRSWQAVSTTGQAALTALPTTTAGFTLTNSEAATGKCYAIDSFGSWEAVVDATQTDVTAIFAMLNKYANATKPSGGTAETAFRSLSARSNYDGAGTLLRGGTVVNDGWNPGDTFGQMAAAAAGANWKVNEVKARGLYLVTPGAAFSVQAVKAAAAAAAQQFFFIRWHEVQIIWNT